MDCSICGNAIEVTLGGRAEGNNAEPVNDGRCCDSCNAGVVIAARMQGFGYFLRQFVDLACSLSPENIWRDGEATRSEVMKRTATLRAEWRVLEKRIGMKITEDAVWKWGLRQETDERRRA